MHLSSLQMAKQASTYKMALTFSKQYSQGVLEASTVALMWSRSSSSQLMSHTKMVQGSRTHYRFLCARISKESN